MPTPVTTIGREILQESLPAGMAIPAEGFDKKSLNDTLSRIAQSHPDEYEDILQKLVELSQDTMTDYGAETSIGLDDLRTPPRLRAYRKELRKRIQQIAQDPNLEGKEKNAKIVDVMRKALDRVQKSTLEESLSRGNFFAKSTEKGFRGNPTQLTQLLFGDRLNADHKGRPVPIPGLTGYGAGVDPIEYWGSTYGARKGYWDVQFATAQTGFFGKQMAVAAQGLKVTEEDCGVADRGMPMDGDDPDVIGKVLIRPTAGLPAGTTINKNHLKLLNGQEPVVRSVTTCQAKQGVCQRCNGLRADGKFPPVGAFVGLDSARLLSEPLTQLGLSSKHAGGQVGVNDQNLTGFDSINQLFQVPSRFIGGAAMAPADGRITDITEAPQGGHFIKVGDEEIYVPEGREIKVKPGQKVEAGDVLTDGMVNPSLMAKYKGIGEARRQFVRSLDSLLKENNVSSHKRHLEIMASAFVDRVRVTDPEGVGDYRPGAVVPYRSLASTYKPRAGFQELAPSRAVGSYLESPILHYSIGTRITPTVAATLEKQGIKRVSAHKQAPGFEPEVSRLMTLSSSDPNWKARMSGFYLGKSLLDAAQHGATAKKDDPSPVSFLMNPAIDI